MSNQSPSQTVGPFFHIGLIREGENMNVMVSAQTSGQRILVRGKVLDGDGEPISDAMLEIWQADAEGIYGHPADPRHSDADPAFGGFGRAPTNNSGEYSFKTIKPGAIEREGETTMAPHINFRIFARGMLIHAYTRMYFPDQAENEADAVLQMISNADRRLTLIADQEAGDDLPTYRFDLFLQGEKETVFFDL
jgi:protocatechuate 3,4-dioxygenase alpha subunit